jgi:hypothetical protein
MTHYKTQDGMGEVWETETHKLVLGFFGHWTLVNKTTSTWEAIRPRKAKQLIRDWT